MPLNTIDIPTFTGLQETHGAEFVAEVVNTFLEEAPQMLAGLRQAQAEGAAEPFRRAAHSLKSNSQAFGAMKLGEMARELELGGLPVDPAAIDALAEEYARAAAALKGLSHG